MNKPKQWSDWLTTEKMMDEQVEEWVVYGVHTGYVDSVPAKDWDAHMETLRTRRRYTNLTLLARGLTQEQAEAMKRLANDGENE